MVVEILGMAPESEQPFGEYGSSQGFVDTDYLRYSQFMLRGWLCFVILNSSYSYLKLKYPYNSYHSALDFALQS